jgi:alpha-tubulin suppressor-like RCC1 family protein
VDHAWTDVRLGNDTGDWLVLRSPAGQAVDSVDWGAAPGEAASPPPSGTSLSLRSSHDDNLHLRGAGSGWRAAVDLYGTGQRGTPGARNRVGISLVAVSPGGDHSCGLDAAGQAWCWGYNQTLQLGTGSKRQFESFVGPVLQPAGMRFVDIMVIHENYSTSCALNESGRIYCWGGRAPMGQGLGLVGTPWPIPQPDGVRFASLSSGVAAACALTTDGQAWCWGATPWGQPWLVPVAAAPQPEGVSFSSLGVANMYVCGLSPAGQAYCAGKGIYDVTWSSSFVPVDQAPGVTFASIDAGVGWACALTASGQAYCWGDNFWGMLGDGTTERRPVPVAVHQPPGVSFTAISIMSDHACALSPSGQAYCWGSNAYGNLGYGTAMDWHLVPTPVRQPAGLLFSAVTAGFEGTCALERGTGQPYCWGHNGWGQLGDGTTQNRLVPVAATP